MSESIILSTGSKKEQYETILPQIKALITVETDLIANLANITAALKAQFNWLWVGFYLVKNNELVLAPFQGPIACTRIKYGKGVCGTAWAENKTYIVANVDEFPGHIACSSSARSEIVIPIVHHDIVMGVLDIDSEQLAFFDETDALFLTELTHAIRF